MLDQLLCSIQLLGEKSPDRLRLAEIKRAPRNQMVYIVPVALVRGNTPCRSMRLFQKAKLFQIGHFVADGRGTVLDIAALGNAARPNRLGRANIIVHDGIQYHSLAFA
ncbi:hypothetical protein D3C73_1289510 [compost metagenome]